MKCGQAVEGPTGSQTIIGILIVVICAALLLVYFELRDAAAVSERYAVEQTDRAYAFLFCKDDHDVEVCVGPAFWGVGDEEKEDQADDASFE